jgi:hypothetical protein
MTIEAPQIIYFILVSLSLLVGAVDPGKNGHKFYTALITNALTLGLLYWGGFFGCNC